MPYLQELRYPTSHSNMNTLHISLLSLVNLLMNAIHTYFRTRDRSIIRVESYRTL